MEKQLHILLVEDDDDDIELLKEALTDNNVNCQVDVVNCGDKVISFIEKSFHFPDIILLDLNLPKMHGREVLKSLKSRDSMKNIPVVIHSTSSSQEDKDYCLSEGARSFITKPTTSEGFTKTVSAILKYSL